MKTSWTKVIWRGNAVRLKPYCVGMRGKLKRDTQRRAAEL